MKRPYFKLTDLIVILLVIFVSASSFVFIHVKNQAGSAPAVAEIRVNSQVVKTIELTSVRTPYEITVEGNLPVTLEVSREGIRFINAKCPDGLCMHSGLIEANESAACLPAGVSVKVMAQSEPEIDGVVG
ncbi:MAG: NusG domain II-containing protein [Ruminococcus sp.]|nr:NusG domain II-containing protein [Ruminococcus sp.]